MLKPKISAVIPIDLFRLMDRGVTKETLARELSRLDRDLKVEDRDLQPFDQESLRQMYDQWDRYAPGKDELRRVEIFLPDHEMEALDQIMAEKTDVTLQRYLTNAAHAVFMYSTTAEEREAGYEDRRLGHIYFNMEHAVCLLRYISGGRVQYLRSRSMPTPFACNLELAQACSMHSQDLSNLSPGDETMRMESITAEQYRAALEQGKVDEPTSILAEVDLDAMTFAYAYPGEGSLRAYDLRQTVELARQVYLEHQGLCDRNRIFLRELRKRGGEPGANQTTGKDE